MVGGTGVLTSSGASPFFSWTVSFLDIGMRPQLSVLEVARVPWVVMRFVDKKF